MDFKYIMHKNRYKFLYNNRALLHDLSNLSQYRKELSLYIKELFMYNISLKALSAERPRPIIKDELINIAAVCRENLTIFKFIQIKRALPIKELSQLTGKSQRFFEKWNQYILSYFIILNHDNYSCLYSFLSIEENSNTSERTSYGADNNTLQNGSSRRENTYSGILLKRSNRRCYILTPSGDFCAITSSEDISPGQICSGLLKKERDYLSIPIRIFLVLLLVILLAIYFIYSHIEKTVVIKCGFSIELKVNQWDRVISSTPLDTKANEVKNLSTTFNKPVDSAIVSILEAGVKQQYIKDSSIISIYVNDSDKSTDLDNLKSYISKQKFNVIINNNGSEIQPVTK